MQLVNITEMSDSDATRDSAHDQSVPEKNLLLDELFSQLSKEIEPQTSEPTDEFSAIQKLLEKLPQIKSDLETHMDQATNEAKKLDVVKINDPITRVKRTAKDEPEDSGSEWFNMKKPEMTAEIKRDLLILKNRSALDPKRHYKKEKWQVPKYFQTGTIVEGNTEFYSARLSRKNRGKTLAEEILHDDDSSKYFKRKYYEIQKQKTSGGKKHYKKIKEKRRGF